MTAVLASVQTPADFAPLSAGRALLAIAAAVILVALIFTPELLREHRRRAARVRRLHWLDEARARRAHPTSRTRRGHAARTRHRLEGRHS